jgi:hypothetical protein
VEATSLCDMGKELTTALALNRPVWPNLAVAECPSIFAAARWQFGNAGGGQIKQRGADRMLTPRLPKNNPEAAFLNEAAGPALGS